MRLLVVGAGFLGGKIVAKSLALGFDAKGTTLRGRGAGDFALDIRDAEAVSGLFAEFKPDVVVNCASAGSVDYCERHPGEALGVNLAGAGNVAVACKSAGVKKLVFVSTDYVFDGEKGNYAESDAVNPLNVYGRSKALAEKAVLGAFPGSLVLRASTVYGSGPGDGKERPCFARWVFDSLSRGRGISVVSDQVTCPTYVEDFAGVVLELVGMNAGGLFHASGPEPISRADFSRRVACEFSLDASLINVVDSSELGQAALRPKNSSLSTSRLNSFGLKTVGVGRGLKKMRAEMCSLD